MKKILALMLCVILVFSVMLLASCDNTGDNTNDSTAQSTPASGSGNGGSGNGGSDNGGSGNGGSGEGGSGSGPVGGSIADLNGKTAEELYQAALETVSGLTNYTMKTEQVIVMTNGAQSQTVNQTVISKMNGQDLYANIYNDTTSDANMTYWYVNEWFYVIQKGVYGKANITYERMVNEFMPEGATSEGALMTIPEKWLKEIKFEKEGDLYYIELIVSGKEYVDYMKSTALAASIQDVDDVSYKVYFTEDGELGNVVTKFSYVVEGVNCDATSTAVITDIGTTTIETPSGNFTDVTGKI